MGSILMISKRFSAPINDLVQKLSVTVQVFKNLNFYLYSLALLPAMFLYRANIGLKSIWFDEAIQFWISQGRPTIGPPFGIKGNISAISFYNKSANLDPGGYGYLLRVWTELAGTSLATLKTFSFVFYFLSILFIMKLTLVALEHPLKKIIATITIMTIYYSLIPRQYALEIRPYSMALFASTGIALTLYLYMRRPTLCLKYSLSTMLLFGIWARYNTYVFVLAAFATLGIYTLLKRIPRREVIHIVLIPIVCLIYIYFSTTRFQNSGQPPAYVISLLLHDASSSQFMGILRANFVEGFGILFSIGIVFIILKGLSHRAAHLADKFKYERIKPLNYWFILSIIFSASFSLTGHLPWFLSSRWSIDQYALTAVAVILALEASSTKFLSTLGLGTIVAFLVLNSSVHSFKDRWLSSDGANPVGQNIKLFRDNNNIAIDTFIYPETIYLLEASGLFPDGRNILKSTRIVPYAFATAAAEDQPLILPNSIRTLILSLNWSSDTDKNIEKYLLKNGFVKIRTEARQVGGLGYSIYSKL